MALTVTTFDQKIAEWFNSIVTKNGWPIGNLLLCLIAILLTVILCSFVGFERERRGRSAGLRTHLLVGVGSCVIMIVSIYGFPSGETRDVARLAAGVVSGVGFLGAGAIIHANGGIKGLTTAGTIWLVMAIGLACGSMNFIIAVVTTIIVMIVLVCFRPLEKTAARKHPLIQIVVKDDVPVSTIILDAAKNNNCSISSINSSLSEKDNCIQVTFKLNNESGEDNNIIGFTNELKEKAHPISLEQLNKH